MSTLVGTLAVDVTNGTATFKLDDAKSELDSFGKKVQDTQSTVDYSMGEARHSVMMLGEEFGVHLPRGVTTFIASLGPIGPALEAAFPFLAIALGATLLIEHLTKIKAAAEGLSSGFDKSNQSIDLQNDELKVSIARYQEMIDKLNGNYNNGAAVALAEARVEADKLSKSISEDIAGLQKLMQESAHGSVMTFLMGTSGSGQAADVAAGLKDAIAKIPHDSNFTANMTKAIQESWQRAQSEINKNNAEVARTKAINDSSDGTIADIKLPDFTEANQALQQYQEHLSRLNEDMDLTKLNDSLKSTVRNLQEYDSQIIHLRRDSGEFARAREKAAAEDVRLYEEQEAATRSFNEFMEKSYHEQLELSQQVGEEELKNTLAMAKIEEKAQEEQSHFELAMRTSSAKQVLAAEIKAVEDATKVETDGFKAQLNNLDKFAKDYLVKYKELKDKITQTEAQSDAQVVALSHAAMEKQEDDVKQAYSKLADSIGQNIAKSIVENKNLAASMRKTGEEMLETAIQNVLKMIMLHDMKKLSDAKVAAADAYAWAGNPVLGAVLAAGAFSAVMAFEQGGIVPGQEGNGVPIMAHAQEMVLPAPISQGLQSAINGGTFGGNAGDVHIHAPFAPKIQAFDADGVDKILAKHRQAFATHIKNELRRMHH
jgi:hypothetical protein